MPFRAGFVAIIGRPNAGKSTFLNRLVGHKVAIVTSRPQTTRNRILGMVNRPNAQVVLIDTPGIHRADSILGRQMMDELAQALEGIDVLAVMIDASQGVTREDRLALDRAQRFSGRAVLLLNKIDRMPKSALLPLIESCSKDGLFSDVIPISALTGDGVEIVLECFIAHLPEANRLSFSRGSVYRPAGALSGSGNYSGKGHGGEPKRGAFTPSRCWWNRSRSSDRLIKIQRDDPGGTRRAERGF